MIVALLAFYDESEMTLQRLVTSLARVPDVGRLIALDGAYELYPHGGRASPPKQRRAIRKACDHAGIECRYFAPEKPWPTEMEKRTRLFELGEMDTQPNDWLWVTDADYEVSWAPPDLGARLAHETEYDVAKATLVTPRGEAFPNLPPVMTIRCLFRSRLGIRVEGNHYTYITEDGRQLWGSQYAEPALDLSKDIRLVHHTNRRDVQRTTRQQEYYRARDAAGTERTICGWCGGKSIGMMPTNLHPIRNGLNAHWAEVCEDCAPRVAAENEEYCRAWGLTDDEMAEVTTVAGRAES